MGQIGNLRPIGNRPCTVSLHRPGGLLYQSARQNTIITRSETYFTRWNAIGWCAQPPPPDAPPRRALALVEEWGMIHKAELTENWRLCREKAHPGKIEPLV